MLSELRTRGKLSIGERYPVLLYWRAWRLLQFSKEEWYEAKPIHLHSIQKEAISYDPGSDLCLLLLSRFRDIR